MVNPEQLERDPRFTMPHGITPEELENALNVCDVAVSRGEDFPPHEHDIIWQVGTRFLSIDDETALIPTSLGELMAYYKAAELSGLISL